MVFLMYFCSLLLEKRILLDFFGFCTGTFAASRKLLRRFPMLSHFVLVNRILFHKCTAVVRLD